MYDEPASESKLHSGKNRCTPDGCSDKLYETNHVAKSYPAPQHH